MKVVFLVGPTASGKSALALELAEKRGGVILNADSVQVYQRLLIGAAAPTESEKKRVPHYLYQEAPPPEHWTAGDYSRRAHEILLGLQRKTDWVFVVGGTGFYLQALEKGMYPVEKADPRIQAELEAQLKTPEGPDHLHQELKEKDPPSAARISIHDHYRLARALEIVRRSGKTLSEIEKSHRESARPFPYPLLKLGIRIERETLRERVKQRTSQMLRQGLVQEAKALIQEGFRDWEPLQSVGYKETMAYLGGDPELADEGALRDKIVMNTMRLAKKQRTWFQRDPQIRWREAGDSSFFLAELDSFSRMNR